MIQMHPFKGRCNWLTNPSLYWGEAFVDPECSLASRSHRRIQIMGARFCSWLIQVFAFLWNGCHLKNEGQQKSKGRSFEPDNYWTLSARWCLFLMWKYLSIFNVKVPWPLESLWSPLEPPFHRLIVDTFLHSLFLPPHQASWCRPPMELSVETEPKICWLTLIKCVETCFGHLLVRRKGTFSLFLDDRKLGWAGRKL